MGLIRAESNVAGHIIGDIWDELESEPGLVAVLLENGQLVRVDAVPEIVPEYPPGTNGVPAPGEVVSETFPEPVADDPPVEDAAVEVPAEDVAADPEPVAKKRR